MSMSLIYHSILEGVRMKKTNVEIIKELTSQSRDNRGLMLHIVLKDLIEIARRENEDALS